MPRPRKGGRERSNRWKGETQSGFPLQVGPYAIKPARPDGRLIFRLLLVLFFFLRGGWVSADLSFSAKNPNFGSSLAASLGSSFFSFFSFLSLALLPADAALRAPLPSV